MPQVIPVTEARRILLKLVDQIDEQYTRVDLTKNGRVKATLVSSEYLDSLEETIYSLEHSIDDIREAKKSMARGEYVTLEELLKELNIDASQISSSQQKSRKTNRKATSKDQNKSRHSLV